MSIKDIQQDNCETAIELFARVFVQCNADGMCRADLIRLLDSMRYAIDKAYEQLNNSPQCTGYANTMIHLEYARRSMVSAHNSIKL